MPRPWVVVVGDALLDVRVMPHEATRHGGDVPATIRLDPGGQGANVAVRLARQGVVTHLVCALADDVPGAMLRAALEADGVRLSSIPTSATGTVVVLGGHDGERTMLSDRSPFAPRAAEAVSSRPPPPWVVVSGYPLLEDDAPALAGAVAALPSRRVVVGCAVPTAMVERWRSATAAVQPDLLVLNRDEASGLDVRSAGVGVVVTDARGATASVGGMDVEVHAPGGSPALDTTGAGDAFTAGLVGALLDAAWPPSREALEVALRSGVALAGAVARSAGAQAPVQGERRESGA